jgi:NitT/TauT family transport system ATP-binding protein
MSGIELTDVVRRYGAGKASVLALDRVNLTLPDHSFTTLIGASGCGKSTLLRLLGDLDSPTEGSVQINGEQPSKLRKAGKIGVAFQDPSLLPWRNTRKNIALTLQAAGKPIDWAAIDKLIALVGLSGFENSKPGQLSGGMKQRVSIARALVLQPELLLLDEPFGALDELLRTSMNLELQRIWLERRNTTVMVTHSVSEAVFLSDYVVIMGSRPGRVVEMVKIPFARPRDAALMHSEEFHRMCDHVSERLGAAIAGSAAIDELQASA